MARLIDIANKAGVSVGLVSRILSNDKSLSMNEEKKKQVLEIAQEMGYRKKIISKGHRVAIFNWYDIEQEVIDPFYYYIRHAVCEKLYDNNIEYSLYFSNDEVDFLTNIDGIIAIGKFDEEKVTFFESITQNVVFIDSNPRPSKFTSVIIDYEDITKEIVSHFYNSGHRKIAFVGGQEFLKDGSNILDKRQTSFTEFTKSLAIFKEEYVKIGKFTTESGYSIGYEIVAQGNMPTAIFCANDQIAIGLIRALHENKINVPNDIEVFGFNNVPFASYYIPSLSTANPYLTQMGYEGVNILISNFKKEKITPKKVIIHCELIFRETTNTSNT